MLQPSTEAAVGEEVGLEFKIAEVRAVLNVRGRVVRIEGNERGELSSSGSNRKM